MVSLIDLEGAIKRLERLVDVLSSRLEFWTVLVVIGLVVEYSHDFLKLIWRREFDRTRWRELVGGIFIPAGVAGELFVGRKISSIESELRGENGRVIALLNKEAEEARLAHVTLEKLIQPRRLTSEQEGTLRSKTETFAGTRVICKVYDAEG